MDKSAPIEANPVTALSSGFVGDVHTQTNNTSSPTPLMVTPLPPVAPHTTSDAVMISDDEHNTESLPPVMVTPRQEVIQVTTFDELMMISEETDNTVSLPPLMATPARTVGQVISFEDLMMITDETHIKESLPSLMVSPAETVAPVTGSDDVMMIIEETHNTESLAPLMVTPAETVAPVVTESDVVMMINEETHNSESLPPSLVTPLPKAAPVTGSDDVMMIIEESHNTSSPPSLMVSPAQTIAPVTASVDVMITEETHNTEPLPPLMVTSGQAVAPVTAPEDVMMIIEETHKTDSLPPPMVTPPLPTAAPDTSLYDVIITIDESFNTKSLPGPLMVTPLRTATSALGDVSAETHKADSSPQVMFTPLAMVPYGYDFNNNNNSNAAAEAGPSTGPIKRGRGRPKGSKNKNSKTASKKRKTPDTDGNTTKSCPILGGRKSSKNKKSKTATKKDKPPNPNRKLNKSCPISFVSGITQEKRENGDQEQVDSVLMRADAARRRLYQINAMRSITAVINNYKNLGVKTNQKKRIGPVPGIQVGDIFYYWGEMNLVGLHLPPVAGIGHFTVEDDAPEGSVAISVVSTGRYRDDKSDINVLIYTGHGGKDKNKQPCDQKLKRGNKAMVESKTKGNDVRVIIGDEDANKKRIYVYNGLYTVTDYWIVENPKAEFKFRLVRKPDQPSGYSTWKTIEQWRKEEGSESSREGFVLGDLSGGEEALSVTVVNDLDVTDKQLPQDFEYTRSLIYSSTTPLDPKTDVSTIGCLENCLGRSCFTEDADCVCVRKNGNELPYRDRFLVCRKPTVFECGDSCLCVSKCNNRVVQMGVKLRLEVFKTETCGWGLRSWDPIQAGTFICEFAGKNKTEAEIEEDDEYLFDSSRVFESFKWNYEPELAMESGSERVPEEFDLKSRILISGKSHGNVGRFMNHSCWANVMWQPVECERNGEFYYRVGFFAKKHIPPLTELTYDYGVSGCVAEENGEDGRGGGGGLRGKKICLCGSFNCRGFFG